MTDERYKLLDELGFKWSSAMTSKKGKSASEEDKTSAPASDSQGQESGELIPTTPADAEAVAKDEKPAETPAAVPPSTPEPPTGGNIVQI